jgi:hypothetical protein
MLLALVGLNRSTCSHSKGLSIENVFLVNGLKHNLLSISQLCDKGYKIIFNHACYLILEMIKFYLLVIEKKMFIRLKLMHA